MSGEQEAVRTCNECGAAIQREDLKNRAAARYKGRLLCPDCVRALMARISATKKAGDQAESQPELDDAPIALVDDGKPRVVGGPSKQIHRFSGTEMTVQRAAHEYKRPLLKNTRSATRCRTFHCKMTDASITHMNEQINEWVDENEDVEIKFALSNIGVVEGKHADPHLVITLFY